MHFDFEEIAEYKAVIALSFVTDPEEHVATLVMDLAKEHDLGAEMVRLECVGVYRLSLKDFNGKTSIMCLRIEDIQHKQWEGLNFHVLDLEDEQIDFFCRSVSLASGYHVGEPQMGNKFD